MCNLNAYSMCNTESTNKINEFSDNILIEV